MKQESLIASEKEFLEQLRKIGQHSCSLLLHLNFNDLQEVLLTVAEYCRKIILLS